MVSRAFLYVMKRNLLVSLLACVAFIFVILLDVVFANTEAIFQGGAELSMIFSNLCMSFVAGYVIYIMTSVKLEADRINKSKEIANQIVVAIRNRTVSMFQVLAETPHEKFTTFPSEKQLSSYLTDKTFVMPVKAIRYIDVTGSYTFERDLHFFLFEDFPKKAMKLQASLSIYMSFLDQDMQVAFYKYFNSNFFDNFSDPTLATILKDRHKKVSNFTNSFLVLRKTTLELINSYERVYGSLIK